MKDIEIELNKDQVFALLGGDTLFISGVQISIKESHRPQMMNVGGLPLSTISPKIIPKALQAQNERERDLEQIFWERVERRQNPSEN